VIDPFLAEIIRNHLETLADEMCIVMKRTARSQIFRETNDLSAVIFDGEGNMMGLAQALVGQMAPMKFSVRWILDLMDDIQDGDVFVTNDPYYGGTHLQDLAIVKPVFFEGRRIMFTAIRGHQMDMGGTAPGSYYPAATEIYQEGLRVPPVKIYDAGKPRDDIFRMLQANVRVPTFSGDLQAMMSANLVAERRLRDLARRYGPECLIEHVRYLQDYAEQRVRAEVATWPDGEYEGEDFLEHDGRDNRDIRAYVKVVIQGDQLSFDFEGSAAQAEGFVNATISNTTGFVFHALAYMLDTSIPLNEGVYRAINVHVPEGTWLNPRPPAPVAASSMPTNATVVNAITYALVQAVPDKVTQIMPHLILPPHVHGVDPRTGQWYVNGNRDFYAGGAGAVHGVDGWAGCYPLSAGIYFSPIEMIEVDFPCLTVRNEYVINTGGAGFWRGMPGNAIERKVVEHTAHGSAYLWGNRYPPKGLLGGKDGSPSSFSMKYGSKDEVKVDTWVQNVRLLPGESYFIQSAGGPGFGDPLERSPEKVRDDVLDEFITIEQAFEDYRVVIDPVTLTVDKKATEEARAAAMSSVGETTETGPVARGDE
jgi:N-methylhydantoinase B